ncbi:hypothetical protein K466DRAFT_603955 [Polyporus arcularius HHB13444]|uniref:Uncharacterized protein n=1 Tax=Polyporus arcularius HHB13444 TaxID=1314778 RepID=A0A5C3NYC6_9APHY|nr:hypothetical protein K466DRAFT_603955 [Polyporus arcularius HHB13444]
MADILDLDAAALHKKAWGTPWPHRSSGKLSIADLSPDEDMQMSIETDEDDDNVNTTTTEWEYTCLHNIHSVVTACGGVPDAVRDVLVIRPEYVWLRETIETGYLRTTKAIVVTGHPGIGKTVWLLQVLLHRLERKLPTAIHLSGDRFVVFDDEGATVRDARNRADLSRDYWALSDSNHDIRQPCRAFRFSNARVIHTTPPRPDRCKEWKKQHSASLLVSEVPRPHEIGAIARELGLDVAEAYRYISKWGPCTRTILDLLNASPEERASNEEKLTHTATTAARTICTTPLAFAHPACRTVPSVGFTILFVFPYRELDPDTSQVVSSVDMIYRIPTIHLSDIFNSARGSIANADALHLFHTLSFHAVTKATPAWQFEKKVHAHLSSNSQPLDIFSGSDSSMIEPSQRLLVGTAGALGQSSEFSSFYWLPATSDFQGIDGVLADRHNVHAVQAILADEHDYDSPSDGLRNLWAKFDYQGREKRVWHVVFVSDSKQLASKHADKCAGEMEGFTLGQHKKEVNIWGCVLPSPQAQLHRQRDLT